MHANTRFFILQLCYFGLALSQFYPPKYPVPPNKNDFCARFNGILRDDISASFRDLESIMFDKFHPRCFDCGTLTGEYVRTEFRCDGKEDCSTGCDETYCDSKSFFKQFSKAFPSQVVSRRCCHDDSCYSGYCKNGYCTG